MGEETASSQHVIITSHGDVETWILQAWNLGKKGYTVSGLKLMDDTGDIALVVEGDVDPIKLMIDMNTK